MPPCPLALAFRSLLRFLATGMKKSLTAVAIASKLDVLATGSTEAAVAADLLAATSSFSSSSAMWARAVADLTAVAAAGALDFFLKVRLVLIRVDTKWRFQFFAKYDYRFLSDVIIAIIATFFAKAIIAEYFA